MTTQINGQQYRQMMDYGIRNLSLYRDQVNALNVFPVPDGDTGSNMVMTLQNGLNAMQNPSDDLSNLAKQFSRAVVFGARGNSGVIVSQFFKGFSECFGEQTEADCPTFIRALEVGVESAYRAVRHPVEGTVLTVLREATSHVREEVEKGHIHTIDETVDAFVGRAKISLSHTPDLLPILKSAGVVDSGGAGIVYVFEGMQKYFRGEILQEAVLPSASTVGSYDDFCRTSDFSLGYCTECLIQLTDGKADFVYSDFLIALEAFGGSLVTAFEKDKVKVHIHTDEPERFLAFCHRFGEFLTVKIENMSVQHHETIEQASVFYAKEEIGRTSLVAVAHDAVMKQRFMDMGVDAVILGDRHCPPSAADFLDVFAKIQTENIFVFPNHKNTELVAEQAKSLYSNANIVVFPTKFDTECYAMLPMMDFEEEQTAELANQLQRILDNIDTVTIVRADQSSCLNGIEWKSGDYLAMAGNRVLAAETRITEVGRQAIDWAMAKKPQDILTLFVHRTVSEEQILSIGSYLKERYPEVELSVADIEDEIWQMVFSFE